MLKQTEKRCLAIWELTAELCCNNVVVSNHVHKYTSIGCWKIPQSFAYPDWDALPFIEIGEHFNQGGNEFKQQLEMVDIGQLKKEKAMKRVFENFEWGRDI